MTVERLSFGPRIRGLDEALEGGVPRGSWVVLFGNPGAYKTLHSLSFALAGVEADERVVYVSTEQDWRNLKTQIESLGWKYKAHEAHLTLKLLESKDFGAYDVVWVDLDSLRYLAWKLNRLVREEKEGSRRKKYYWYYDPDLLTFAIILGLEGVGSIQRKESDITLEQVERIRIKEGYYGSKYSLVKMDKNVKVRVIIDSVSVLFTARWSIAGRVLTDMKIRLEAPLYTFLLTSHVSRSSEEEMGAQVGHIVDGRIRLWNELDARAKAGVVTGWIAKMRLTDHSRLLHYVSVVGSEEKRLVWEPVQRGVVE